MRLPRRRRRGLVPYALAAVALLPPLACGSSESSPEGGAPDTADAAFDSTSPTPPTAVDASADAAAPRRPNIVILLTDDQRYDALGVVQREQGANGRFSFFRDGTPNIDRLAAGGVRFRNAFVVNSLCSPSRAVFLTGRYNHLNGVANNHTSFPIASVTYASVLRDAGYATGYFGKWHMGSQTGRPGFEHYASFVGQGRFVDCPLLIDDATETPTTGWVDDVTTDHAVKFIQANAQRSFVAVLAFKSPHGPRTPPTRLATRYATATLAAPPNATAYAPFVPPAEQQPNPPGAEDARNYFRVLTAVDENVGRVLDALDAAGIADDTVVLYASDNGYFLGEHARGDKRLAYEESVRIPFILRYPRLGGKGTTVDATVLNLDVAPTLLALAGLAAPSTMQGSSILPLLDGTRGSLRDGFLYEYFFENNFDVPTIVGFRGATTKVVTYPGHPAWRELFDLASDPHENNDLDPGSPTLEAMMARLRAEQTAVGYTVPSYADTPP